MNCYDQFIAENRAEIKRLRNRIERAKAGAPHRAGMIERTEAEIAKLEKQISTYRGTSALTRAMTGF